MVLLLFALLLYTLVLLAEKALLAVSPHELEAIRATPGAGARRAVALGRQVRPALAALMLARLFLKVLAVVGGAFFVFQHPVVRRELYAWSLKTGLPGELIYALAAVVLAFVFALAFRLLWKIPLFSLAGGHGRWLQYLGAYIVFWQQIFAPFIKKDIQTPTTEPAPASTPSPEPSISEEKREIELLRSIIKFSDTTVKQVMQPRSKVVGLDFRATFHEVLAAVREAGFSRLPVYDEDLDNVTGILYVKDLVPHLDQDADFEWQTLIRTNILHVPESKHVNELLQDFKENKLHMAIVVDEYGGSSGLVTMEDVLEEVTGEIRDEFDEENELRYRKLDDFNFLFEGQTLLNDVCRIAGLAPDAFDAVRGDADTVAGLALELNGDIPAQGAEIPWNGYTLTVTAANNRKIEQIKLTLPKL